MYPGRPLRVLHAPELIGGNPLGLARAERELGVDTRVIAFRESALGYGANEDILVVPPIKSGIRRLEFISSALAWADVVHFNFGRSLLPSRRRTAGKRLGSRLVRSTYNSFAYLLEGRDLAWLRSRHKGVVVTFQGSDARMPSRILADHPARTAFPGAHGSDDRLRTAQIAKWDRYAHTIYALNPDLLRHLPDRAEFLPYASVDPTSLTVREWPAGDELRVVHAPTARVIKGTKYVVGAVELLRAQGVPIHLDLVEGVTHSEALRRYAKAHVGVDQLLLGWYGALAVELMALGIPVFAFLDTPAMGGIPPAMARQLPVLNTNREELVEQLRTFASLDRDKLRWMGCASRAYVEDWHDPRRIAQRTVEDYRRILRCA